MNTQAVINNHTNLTPTSQPEQTTQEPPQSTLRVEDLNNLIEEMVIEKTLDKKKAPKPSSESEN